MELFADIPMVYCLLGITGALQNLQIKLPEGTEIILQTTKAVFQPIVFPINAILFVLVVALIFNLGQNSLSMDRQKPFQVRFRVPPRNTKNR